jgi:hypothetical protein
MTFSNNKIPGSAHDLAEAQTAPVYALWVSKHNSFQLTKKLHN